MEQSKRTGGTEWLTALLVRQGAEQGDLSAQRSVSHLDWREAVLFGHWALGTRKAAIPPLKRLGMTWSCWSGKVYAFLLVFRIPHGMSCHHVQCRYANWKAKQPWYNHASGSVFEEPVAGKHFEDFCQTTTRTNSLQFRHPLRFDYWLCLQSSASAALKIQVKLSRH